MNSIELVNASCKIGIGISPNEADLAVVSIDAYGNAGKLNMYVLDQLGYTEKDLPTQDLLDYGVAALRGREGKKIVLFVVTVGKDDTAINLEKNLYNILLEFKEQYREKKIWIPLMGTGAGGLTLEESYGITARVINKIEKEFSTNGFYIISLPLEEDGQELYNRLTATDSKADDNNNDLKLEAKELIDRLKCNFYLVGAYWSGEDKTDQFTSQGIWEKGYDDESYSDTINKVQKGDVLIIKSTYASQGTSYLKVKAVGIVTDNLKDGTLLKVEWRITGLWIDVEDLGFYRDTIAVAKIENVITILIKIGRNRWQSLLPRSNNNKIPGIISDTDEGTDYLDIAKDVRAFARVIAAKNFEPPLAIALFGNWGSGKSFFMRKLRQQIDRFGEAEENDFYCKGVVHIHFNAWSYVDANLWASIVSKIFEGLNNYISNDEEALKYKNVIEKELTDKLAITKEQFDLLKDQRDKLDVQIKQLNNKKGLLSKKLAEKISSIRKQSLKTTLGKVNNQYKPFEAIKKAIESNPTSGITSEQLKKLIPEKYWNNPSEAYNRANSIYAFLQEFFQPKKIVFNVLALLVILAIIYFVPRLLLDTTAMLKDINLVILLQGITGAMAVIGTVWRRAEVTFDSLQPILSSLWKINTDYQSSIDEALFKIKQEEEALKLEIEKNEAEIISVDQQIHQVNVTKADIEYRITHALNTQALYSFIDKRSKSEDYKKHLGIISLIRQDFETLSNLFTSHNKEADKAAGDALFNSMFRKPIQRIVLYIDDLDRCPEENVVQVMDAVNLLMAFPLFVVVVGVDSRWVKNALLKKHALQFTGYFNGNDHSQTHPDLIEPSNYLEKIFQVPFHLNNAAPEKVKGMIRQLAGIKVSQPITNTFKQQSGTPDSPVGNQTNSKSVTQQQTTVIVNTEKAEMVELTEAEIKVMEDVSVVIGNNPRAIKRFVNIYRVIKAHEDFSIVISGAKNELPAILFLLALPMGEFKKLLPSFEEYIKDNGYGENPIDLYLKYSYKIVKTSDYEPYSDIDMVKNKLDNIVQGKDTFDFIRQTLGKVYSQHNEFIKRFTFKNI